MSAKIKTLAIECATQALAQGATEITAPMQGDWDALAELLGCQSRELWGSDSEYANAREDFASEYKSALASKL